MLPDGNRVRIFNFMHSRLDNVMMYQIVQDAMNHLFIDAVPIDGNATINADDMIKELKSYVGDRMKIEVSLVDALRKTEAGKTPRIWSELPK